MYYFLSEQNHITTICLNMWTHPSTTSIEFVSLVRFHVMHTANVLSSPRPPVAGQHSQEMFVTTRDHVNTWTYTSWHNRSQFRTVAHKSRTSIPNRRAKVVCRTFFCATGKCDSGWDSRAVFCTRRMFVSIVYIFLFVEIDWIVCSMWLWFKVEFIPVVNKSANHANNQYYPADGRQLSRQRRRRSPNRMRLIETNDCSNMRENIGFFYSPIISRITVGSLRQTHLRSLLRAH